LKATCEGVFVTFVILEDAGSASLNVWIRRSLRGLTFDGNPPDFTIKGANAKRVALAMLRRYLAKVFLGQKSARLMVAVKVRRSTCDALKLLSRAENITSAEAERMMENPAPRLLIRRLSKILK
jgi:hypothetical protein